MRGRGIVHQLRGRQRGGRGSSPPRRRCGNSSQVFMPPAAVPSTTPERRPSWPRRPGPTARPPARGQQGELGELVVRNDLLAVEIDLGIPVADLAADADRQPVDIAEIQLGRCRSAPSRMASSVEGTSRPSALTVPMPVMATRRMPLACRPMMTRVCMVRAAWSRFSSALDLAACARPCPAGRPWISLRSCLFATSFSTAATIAPRLEMSNSTSRAHWR